MHLLIFTLLLRFGRICKVFFRQIYNETVSLLVRLQIIQMSAKDRFHEAVKTGLQKQGWVITHDPLTIRVSSAKQIHIDLAAEKILAAERQGQLIAVEIKTFSSSSSMFDFHLAIGQFTNYRYALMDSQATRELYLAVPQEVYTGLFSDPFIESVIVRSSIKLIVYDPEYEEIVQWIG
jgi:XisH protein